MPRAKRVCSTPGCPELTDAGRCPGCKAAAEARRGSAAQRGYGHRWSQRRAVYLRKPEHLFCVLCGAPSEVADHYPTSKRDLLAAGVRDPDADHRLRALCASCHGTETTKHQPGGFLVR